jgi:hypothetical protein
MKYQKGTDGYIQSKNVKTWCIIVTAVTVAIFALFVLPSNNFLHQDYKRAGTGWHIAAFISLIANIYVNWGVISKVMDDEVYSGKWVNILTVGWLILNILLLAGFNFSIG